MVIISKPYSYVVRTGMSTSFDVLTSCFFSVAVPPPEAPAFEDDEVLVTVTSLLPGMGPSLFMVPLLGPEDDFLELVVV